MLRVRQGQQDLCDGDVVPRQGLLIGVGQADLSGRRGGLLLLQPDGLARQAKVAPAQRDRARGDHDDLGAALFLDRQVVGQGVQPVLFECAVGLVDEQGGADLDHDALGIGQLGLDRGTHGRNASAGSSSPRSAAARAS